MRKLPETLDSFKEKGIILEHAEWSVRTYEFDFEINVDCSILIRLSNSIRILACMRDSNNNWNVIQEVSFPIKPENAEHAISVFNNFREACESFYEIIEKNRKIIDLFQK